MVRPVADPYVYPGTTTLKNRLGIVDPTMLRMVEYAATTRRELDAPTFPLTAEGYRATHRHLFQDVFPWAGEVRTVGLRNPRHDMEFAFPHAIGGALASRFRQLEGQRNLVGLTLPEFATGAAHHISELNAIHRSGMATGGRRVCTCSKLLSKPGTASMWRRCKVRHGTRRHAPVSTLLTARA